MSWSACARGAVLVAALVPQPVRAGILQHLNVETGVQAGVALGTESPSFPHLRAVTEIGFLQRRAATATWGVVLYGALSSEDLRLAIKPELRRRWSDRWASDVAAGWIFATLEAEPYAASTGWAASLALHHGASVTYRLDLNVRHVDAWPPKSLRDIAGPDARFTDAGTEAALYGGIGLRERPGWWAAGVGTAVLLGLVLIVGLSGGAS